MVLDQSLHLIGFFVGRDEQDRAGRAGLDARALRGVAVLLVIMRRPGIRFRIDNDIILLSFTLVYPGKIR